MRSTNAAGDAATKQSATYHKWADDPDNQAKQIVEAAKPARDWPINHTFLTPHS
jgi:hypothetical protein